MGSSLQSLPWYLDLEARAWTYESTPDVLTLDFETTNIDKGDPLTSENRLVTIGIAVNDRDVVTGLGPGKRVLKRWSGKRAMLVAHNAKFELQWLKRIGIDTSQWLVWDTMIGEYVLAGNRRWVLELGACGKRYGLRGKGRAVARMMEAGICPSEMPEEWVEDRVRSDVLLTRDLYNRQRLALECAGLLSVMFTRCVTTPVLAEIETEGLCLDAERVEEMHAEASKRLAETENALSILTKGINLNSRPQLATFLYEALGFAELVNRRGEPLRTPSGGRKTDSDTIMSLRATSQAQRTFQELWEEYTTLQAALSKNLEFFLGVVRERNRVFRGRFNQTVTRSHRLSASGRRILVRGKQRAVQFQNLPRAMKRLFVARERPGSESLTSSARSMPTPTTGTTWPADPSISQTEIGSSRRLLVEADGAQLEFRVAGHLGRDQQVLEDVVSGADIHRYTGSILNALPEDQVTDSQRTAAKSRTFKPLYGGKSGTKKEVEYYQAFQNKYRGVYDEQTRWTLEVLSTGKLRTSTGLIFYWPDTRMSRDGYISNTPSIFNYPVQSLATADIIPISLVLLFWECRVRGIEATIVNTVHDSVVAEVEEKALDNYRERVVECFLDKTYAYLKAVYGIEMYVPLGVGFKAGTHWGEGEEQKFSH